MGLNLGQVALTQSAAATLKRLRLANGETVRERITKREIGNKSETLVAKALDYLKWLGVIYEYYKSDTKGEMDKKLKIDFLITLAGEKNRLIGLQVKSSVAEKEKHQRTSLIPCVVVKYFHFHTSIRILAEEIMQVTGLSLDDRGVCENDATEKEGSAEQLFDQLGFNGNFELEESLEEES